MSKFNTSGWRPAATAPTSTVSRTTTHAGGVGWNRDDKSALVMLAVVNMVGENTFYEASSSRDERFRGLVRKVAVDDPQWMVDFIGWLRDKANMRSASVVAACEAVKARLDSARKGEDVSVHASFHERGFNRLFIAAACRRADEPGEVLAYWASRYGRKFPKPLKRGVADAATALYTEYSVAKYDSDAKGYRIADVLELTHPEPADDKPYQGPLFRYVIDKRHNRDDVSTEGLRVLTKRAELLALPVGERRAVLLSEDGPQRLKEAGMTWEALSGWLQGPMDKAAWEAIIPSMGVMALLRNLRNFDEAKVSDKVAEQVMAKISNPEDVRGSHVFPYRMLSAYRAAPSLRWGHALDKALDAACGNLPALDGRTLVLVDTSGSMEGHVSAKSTVRHVDVGALFGVALAMRGNEVDLIGFADGQFPHSLVPGGSALKQIDSFCRKIGAVGHGTRIVEAVRATYRETVHNRVVIISDMQTFAYSGWGGGRSVSESVPAHVPMFGINTTGYQSTAVDLSKPNRYEIGGFSDAMFTMVDLLSRGLDSGWPWEL